MKAIAQTGMWKAIAFLTVVIFLFACCEDEILIKAKIFISPAEQITESSAKVMVQITPNQDNTEIFVRYKSAGSDWSLLPVSQKLSGTTVKTIFVDFSGLLPSTSYEFEVSASNAAGVETVKGLPFTTLGLVKATAKMKPAENVTKTTAKVSAVVTPNQDNSEVFIERQKQGSGWSSQSLGKNFSGQNPIAITFDYQEMQLNTYYNVRVRVVNKAGQVISDTITFQTYAVSDFDGNLYHEVTIGNQTFLKENFKGTHFANGDPISNVSQTEWNKNTSIPAYCWYNNDAKIGQEYGGLYNKYVVLDSRELMTGYRVPSAEDFVHMFFEIGDHSSTTYYLPVNWAKLIEAGTAHWKNTLKPGNNLSGFTALPNGYLDPETSTFLNLNEDSNLWTTTRYGLDFCIFQIKSNCSFSASGVHTRNYGMGIRLLKN